MAFFIYSRTIDKAKQAFYLVDKGISYYLFSQKYYKGVKDYFHNKIILNEALDISKSHNNNALIRTKSKIPMYIKQIEKRYGISILETTIKKNHKHHNRNIKWVNKSIEY